jgi:hypothetical protein
MQGSIGHRHEKMQGSNGTAWYGALTATRLSTCTVITSSDFTLPICTLVPGLVQHKHNRPPGHIGHEYNPSTSCCCVCTCCCCCVEYLQTWLIAEPRQPMTCILATKGDVIAKLRLSNHIEASAALPTRFPAFYGHLLARSTSLCESFSLQSSISSFKMHSWVCGVGQRMRLGCMHYCNMMQPVMDALGQYYILRVQHAGKPVQARSSILRNG